MITSISHDSPRVDTGTPAVNDADALVRECMPLVHHHVRALAARIPAHVDRDELVSAGMFALATCAGKYDPAVGTTFAQFAASRIRGALLDELRSRDWASRSVRGRARELAAVRDELANGLGRAPKASEIAAGMGVSVRELSAIEAAVHRAEVTSLDSASANETNGLVSEQNGPEDAVLEREQLAALGQALADLPDRLRVVVEQYFFGQRKMSDIAAELGVTESRVSQLRSQALRRLREIMSDESTAVAATTSTFPTRVVPAQPKRVSPVALLAVG